MNEPLRSNRATCSAGLGRPLKASKSRRRVSIGLSAAEFASHDPPVKRHVEDDHTFNEG